MDKSQLYAELDRGDGICRYLAGNLCTIYNERPSICRVDESYEVFFKQYMEIDEYYLLNKYACDILKKGYER